MASSRADSLHMQMQYACVDGSVCASLLLCFSFLVVVTAKFHFILFLCFDLYALKRAGIPFSSSSLPLLLAPFVQRERERTGREHIFYIILYRICRINKSRKINK